MLAVDEDLVSFVWKKPENYKDIADYKVYVTDDTGDDAVNFATGMGKATEDTQQQSSSHIWTFDNVFRECHGGAIAAGSHTGAGISDMLVEDNVLNYADMPFRFKSAPANGGSIHDVLIRDCAVANADQLFVMTTMYSDSNGVSDTETADKPARQL
ncbi:MAG: hypothetical protein J6M92_13605 [Oribacterium sp.]|nr:hypothetical protein [Oribacterium sp.]